MSLLLARVAPAVTPVDVTDTWSVAVTDAGVVVNFQAPPEADNNSAGFYYEALRIAQQRRARRLREEEEEEAERRIADETAREIARIMHAQAQAEATAAEAQRLREMAQRYADEIASNQRLDRALALALAKQTEGAWLALMREAERAEDEDLMVALLIADD